MARMSAYGVYCIHIAIKNHFNSTSYDFFKYNGKTNTSLEQFNRRKDKYQYQKLCRQYDEKEIKEFILANTLKGKSSWVGDLLDEEAKENYLAYLKRKQAFEYYFSSEIDDLVLSVPTPSEIFKSEDNQYPPILNEYFGGNLSLESMIVLDKFLKFSEKFDARFGENDILWGPISKKMKKAKGFISFDAKKILPILKDKLLGSSNCHT